MKKLLFLTLILLSLFVLSLQLSSMITKLLTNKEKAGIRILSTPSNAEVFINDSPAGQTPFVDENLEQGTINIKLKSGLANWAGQVRLNGGTVTIVNREISEDEASSSGEILTLTKGGGINVVSDPEGAQVEVDGKTYGKTPLFVNIGSGERIFLLSKQGYLKRSIKALVPAGFNLGLNVDLALSELDLSNIAAPSVTVTEKLKVLSTPTGFLRVRDKPNLTGKEIGRVLPGDELILLEELTSWDKVRLTSGTEGYVSSQYVEKITP